MYQNIVTALTQLQTESKMSEKETLLKTYENIPHFKRVISFLVDDFQIVGISTKKLMKELPIDEVNYDLSQLLDYLVENPTGTDQTLSIVKSFLNQHPNESDVLSQIIAKTWTTGVGAKTVNKIYGKSFVPTFDVQLAYAYDKHINKYDDNDKFYVTQKLDGYRSIAIIKNNTVDFYSRKGKVLDGITELKTAILEWVKTQETLVGTSEAFVLDGELLLKNTDNLTSAQLFQATSKALSSKTESTNITFNIFDILTLQEFHKGESEYPYNLRRSVVLDSLTENEFIKIVPVEDIITKQSIHEWSQRATELGWEGVMLNAADGKYQTKRSPKLLKVKQMHTADLEIIGFEEAIDGQFKGSLQSLQIRLDSDNIVLVGSGLTIEDRNTIWENQSEYLGKIAEIQYFEETTNQNGGRSLRFPVFKGIRYDKTIDDINID